MTLTGLGLRLYCTLGLSPPWAGVNVYAQGGFAIEMIVCVLNLKRAPKHVGFRNGTKISASIIQCGYWSSRRVRRRSKETSTATPNLKPGQKEKFNVVLASAVAVTTQSM